MQTTADLGIPLLAQAQANADVTHNEAVLLLQALLNGVLTIGDDVAPGSPDMGDAHIVGETPSGAWAGRANAIAVWLGGWRFIPGNDSDGAPIAMGARQRGLRLYVRSDSAGYLWDGGEWVVSGGGGGDVVSVFGRTGVVVAVADDYDAAQITYSTPTGSLLSADDVQEAIDQLEVLIQSLEPTGGGAVASVFGRSGIVIAEDADYGADQIVVDDGGFSILSGDRVQAVLESIDMILASWDPTGGGGGSRVSFASVPDGHVVTAADEDTILLVEELTGPPPVSFVELPADATEALPVGFAVSIMQTGVSQIEFAEGAGATLLYPPGSTPRTRALNSVLSAVKKEADTWLIFGDDVGGGSGGSLSIEDNGSPVASDVLTLDIVGADAVTDEGGGLVRIVIPASGTGGGGGVETVNGDAGPNVVLDSDDISEGAANLYFTTAERAKLAGVEDLADVTADKLIAGTNVTLDVETDGTVTINAAGGGGGAVDSVNGQTGDVELDTDDVPEGEDNLYFTNERVFDSLEAGDGISLDTDSSGVTTITATGGGGGGREVLTANRTYYVRTDGSDSNNGLADTSGGAWLTLQHADNEIGKLDFGGYTVTLQIGDGTYAAGAVLGRKVGQSLTSSYVIKGNTGTPANTIVSVGAADSFLLNGAGVAARIQDLTLQGGNYCLRAINGASVEFGNIHFGVAANAHILAGPMAQVVAIGNYTIFGGSIAHVSGNCGYLNINGVTVTLTGTPAFSVAFANAAANSLLRLFGNTYSGAATGPRWLAEKGGGIETFGGGVSSLPGSTTGTTTSPGWAA